MSMNGPTIEPLLTQKYEWLYQRVSLRTAFWFFIVLLLLGGIVGMSIWVSGYANKKEHISCHKLTAKEAAIQYDAWVGGHMSVRRGVKAKSLQVNSWMALQPLPSANPTITMSGRRSSIVLTNSTSSPVVVQLPPGSGVDAGYIVVLTNKTPSPTFIVQPVGVDTLNGLSTPLSISEPVAMFMSLGAINGSSTIDWVQLI